MNLLPSEAVRRKKKNASILWITEFVEHRIFHIHWFHSSGDGDDNWDVGDSDDEDDGGDDSDDEDDGGDDGDGDDDERVLPIVGGSAAGSRLGSGRDLPFSDGEHSDGGEGEDVGEREEERKEVGEEREEKNGGGGGGGSLFSLQCYLSARKSNLPSISF